MPDKAGIVASGWVFRPRRVLFEDQALDYDIGRRLWDLFARKGEAPVEVRLIPSHNRVTGLPGASPAEAYREAKRTLVVGVRRGLDFATCRPSAHYQLPLVTSCPGRCEYCYLQTTLGRRPYVRVYVNVEEILARAAKLVAAKAGPVAASGGAPILFEGAAVGDPVPVEPLTGALARAVCFFATLPGAGFRFVTKFPDVDGLIGLDHRGRTRIRVTVNTPRVVRDYDRGTPGLEVRLATLTRLAAAGYPLGVMIAPVFLEEGWQDDYTALFRKLSQELTAGADLTLEVVTHRFTVSARRIIRERHPATALPLTEEGRRLKRGQFGYSKYVYPSHRMAEARELLTGLAERYLPGAILDYIV